MMGHVSKWMEDSQPVHKVDVDAFFIDKYEVTQGAYSALMRENPSDTKRGVREEPPEIASSPIGKDYPVTRVSWFDAARYCNARSAAEGLQPCYDVSTWECDFSKNGYRLPTEAEWEYACRAGTTTTYFFGSDVNDLIDYANYWPDSDKYYEAMAETGKWDKPLPKLLPVGRKKPNPWGLYDMLGNVREWCNDWYDENYYARSPENNPKGPEYGAMKVVRGGSYRDAFVICGHRGEDYPLGKNSLSGLVGFRCVRKAEEAKGAMKGGQHTEPLK
jgi:formylglycine-generating enzyme required for sulfatase activity